MMHCPMCFGIPVLLGRFGHRLHFRCRHCGWQWSDVDDREADGSGEGEE